MNRDQTALRSALEAAHRARDARAAKAHADRLAIKNRRDARAPTREELFAAQLSNYRERADFERAELHRRAQRDEERMRRWYGAKGKGLLDR